MRRNIFLFFIVLSLPLLFFLLHKETKSKNIERVVLCAGDSITADSYPQHLSNFLNQDGYKNIQVINLGRPGNTSGEYLRFLTRSNHWKSPFPDWILLQLGTNDVRIDGDHTNVDVFEKNMDSILNLFFSEAQRQNKTVKIALATILPVCVSGNFDESSIKRVSAEINPKIREIASKHQLPVIDNHSLFLKNPKELPGIHPTQEGYKMLAKNWFEFLKVKIID